MAKEPPEDDMADVDIDIETGNRHDTALHNASHLPDDSAGFGMQGVQIEKDRGDDAGAERPNRGLLADADMQRAIWTNRARWFMRVTIVVDLATAILALTVGAIISSAAMLGYGLEAFVDLAASCLVLWRFWNNSETEEGMRANEDREERANVVIAFIFIAIAIITTGDAADHLAQGKSPEDSFLIIVFAVVTMILLGTMGCVKLFLNSHVKSKALEQDAMASFATAAISVGLLISAALHTANDNIWWLDAVWAIIVTWALALYSLPILFRNRWWHKSFWRSFADN